MRMRLVGSTEARPPVAETYGDEPDPVDPPPEPGPGPDPLVLYLEDGDVFHRSEYLILGYNRFDVMCVGAVGGFGSGYRWTKDNGGQRQFYGGGGGGGGAQRVTGRLALLPSSVPVAVGAASTPPPYFETFEDPFAPSPGYLLPGVDGGPSSFGTICKASGGKGGAAAVVTSTSGSGGAGGEGGIGGSLIAGGGATGWLQPHGEWNPITKIGEGGMGGNGGGVLYPTNNGEPFIGGDSWRQQYSETNAQSGSKGSISDDSLYEGPLDPRVDQHFAHWVMVAGEITDSTEEDVPVIPGFGGGANVQAIKGESEVWGSHAGLADGVVIIRLYRA